MCRVLLSGFSPFDAELLMKGMASAAPNSELRYVAAEQLVGTATTWCPHGLLLGDQATPGDAEIEACASHFPALVVIRLTSRGSTASLVRRGAPQLRLPEISLRTLALLLCGGPTAPGP